MSVAKALFNILSTDAIVGPLLINSNGTYRIHPLKGYLTELTPFVTIQEMNVTANNNKNEPSDVDTMRVQVNVVADSYDEIKSLGRKVRTALDFKQGTFAGVNLQYCCFQNSNDIWEDGGKEQGVAMVAQEYLIRLIN